MFQKLDIHSNQRFPPIFMARLETILINIFVSSSVNCFQTLPLAWRAETVAIGASSSASSSWMPPPRTQTIPVPEQPDDANAERIAEAERLTMSAGECVVCLDNADGPTVAPRNHSTKGFPKEQNKYIGKIRKSTS